MFQTKRKKKAYKPHTSFRIMVETAWIVLPSKNDRWRPCAAHELWMCTKATSRAAWWGLHMYGHQYHLKGLVLKTALATIDLCSEWSDQFARAGYDPRQVHSEQLSRTQKVQKLLFQGHRLRVVFWRGFDVTKVLGSSGSAELNISNCLTVKKSSANTRKRISFWAQDVK